MSQRKVGVTMITTMIMIEGITTNVFGRNKERKDTQEKRQMIRL
jgi:hypothetical protein